MLKKKSENQPGVWGGAGGPQWGPGAKARWGSMQKLKQKLIDFGILTTQKPLNQ